MPLNVDQDTQNNMAYYTAFPCVFDGFVDVPDFSDGVIRLVCTAKHPAIPEKKFVPSYDFAVYQADDKIGEVGLRIGYSEQLYYAGHIWYGIDKKHRGNGYAVRACRLLLPVAKAHGMTTLLITNDPANIASRRVCEKLGARLVRVAKLPTWHDLYQEGRRSHSNIFEWNVTERPSSDKQIVWQGKFLQVAMRGTYECVERRGISGIVGIIAVTDDGKLVLVEQFRPPVQASVIELPAGLAGDVAGGEGESLETAARRELLEETGYTARTMRTVARGASSAGLCDEIITLLLAEGLTRTGPGGGDEHEAIIVHEVPLEVLLDWLGHRQSSGAVIDMKIYSALAFASVNRATQS